MVTNFTRSVRFYYSGSRRIQERVIEPVAVNEDGDVPLKGEESRRVNNFQQVQYIMFYIRASASAAAARTNCCASSIPAMIRVRGARAAGSRGTC